MVLTALAESGVKLKSFAFWHGSSGYGNSGPLLPDVRGLLEGEWVSNLTHLGIGFDAQRYPDVGVLVGLVQAARGLKSLSLNSASGDLIRRLGGVVGGLEWKRLHFTNTAWDLRGEDLVRLGGAKGWSIYICIRRDWTGLIGERCWLCGRMD